MHAKSIALEHKSHLTTKDSIKPKKENDHNSKIGT